MQRQRAISVVAIAILATATLTSSNCGREAPATTAPGATPLTSGDIWHVNVGVLGNAISRVAPGQTLQLYATAERYDGTRPDVTNLAAWSSSDVGTVSVSAGGVVTGVAEGTATVHAIYHEVTGSLDTQVKIFVCAASALSPISRVYSRWGWTSCSDDSSYYGEPVAVTAPQPSCAWTATVDVPWLGIDCYQKAKSYRPTKPGSGGFAYSVDLNNTPLPRTGHITVTFDDGTSLVHTVTEEAPGCSYQTSPTETTVPKDGGSGSFDVVVSPDGCMWTIGPLGFSQATSPIKFSRTSGTGSQRVDYQVLTPNPFTFQRSFGITINGLSGQNPPGSHTVLQSPK